MGSRNDSDAPAGLNIAPSELHVESWAPLQFTSPSNSLRTIRLSRDSSPSLSSLSSAQLFECFSGSVVRPLARDVGEVSGAECDEEDAMAHHGSDLLGQHRAASEPSTSPVHLSPLERLASTAANLSTSALPTMARRRVSLHASDEEKATMAAADAAAAVVDGEWPPEDHQSYASTPSECSLGSTAPDPDQLPASGDNSPPRCATPDTDNGKAAVAASPARAPAGSVPSRDASSASDSAALPLPDIATTAPAALVRSVPLKDAPHIARHILESLDQQRSVIAENVVQAIMDETRQWADKSTAVAVEVTKKLEESHDRIRHLEDQLSRAHARITELEGILFARERAVASQNNGDEPFEDLRASTSSSVSMDGQLAEPATQPPARTLAEPKTPQARRGSSDLVRSPPTEGSSGGASPEKGNGGDGSPDKATGDGSPDKSSGGGGGDAQDLASRLSRPRRLGILKALSQTPFNGENEGHRHLLNKLWKRLHPNDPEDADRDWGVLGFDNPPEEVYEREHMLALHQLGYFAERCKSMLEKIIDDHEKGKSFPLGEIGLKLTSSTLWLLDDNSESNEELDKTFLMLMAHPKAFEEIYCIALRVSRRMWRMAPPGEQHVDRIVSQTESNVLQLLQQRPSDLQELLILFSKQEELFKTDDQRSGRNRTRSELLPATALPTATPDRLTTQPSLDLSSSASAAPPGTVQDASARDSGAEAAAAAAEKAAAVACAAADRAVQPSPAPSAEQAASNTAEGLSSATVGDASAAQ